MSVVDGLSFTEDKKKYILEVLDPVLEEMVADVLTTMPASPADHMIGWLRRRSGLPHRKESAGLSARNADLKRQLANMQESVKEGGMMIKKAEDAESEEEEEEDDEGPDELPPPPASSTRARASVSAEAYGQWNVKKAFTPPVYPKSEDQVARVQNILEKSFLFANLQKKDFEVVVAALEEVKYEAEAVILKEGDDGDCLFVIESGSPVCKKLIGGEDKVVKQCSPGDVFGELALLYNAPRAATVSAGANAAICWKLDRETFNFIVKEAAQNRLQTRAKFLGQVTILNSMTEHERMQIAEVLKQETFKKDDAIVRQDEPGDRFYIVEEGELKAVKSEGGVDRKVMDYKPGDYFGELALLKNQPRAASVVGVSDEVQVLSLERKAFNAMLGPLQDILNRGASRYDA